MKKFDIPVCFFIFKRADKSVEIIKRISLVKPSKLYIISDEGRTSEEKEKVSFCRRAVESAIDWDCEVIKNYADENRGVFDRIGLGALWVLSKEKNAIFLEDDNLPEESFFKYCELMLKKYEKNDDVLWICGTNYFGKFNPSDKSDYLFTHHMLPCGWATWSSKFIKYYDAYFKNFNSKNIKKIKNQYSDKKLFKKDLKNWKMEVRNYKLSQKFSSWDYQMCFTLRYYNKYGIVPKYNQIKNIGVDIESIHGGTTFDNIMTQRFCGMDSYPLSFPLKEPSKVEVDEKFEKKMNQYEIPPFILKNWIQDIIATLIRKLFKIPNNIRIRDYFNKRI